MTPYYEDGTCTIYHGDCLDFLLRIDPTTVALVLTDPPYGISVSTSYKSNGRGSVTGRHAWNPRDHPAVAGDDEPFDPAPLLRFPRCVLFGANNYSSRLPDSQSWSVVSPTPMLTTVPAATSSLYPCGGDLPPCDVKQRESGGDYGAVNPSGCGGYSCGGAWQFDPRTWNNYGGYQYAQDAPPSVQDAKARELYANGAGSSHWGI